MIDITFYKFNKNENSTKVVNVEGVTFKCALIEPTDIINPRIALNHANPTAYNYARIAIFNRYYFVNNWTWSGGRWVALLNVDVLASFKVEIGRQRQYVVRSADQYDGRVVDTLYPTFNKPDVVVRRGDNPYLTNGSCYVVGVVNRSGDVGATSYYTFTEESFRAFCNSLMGQSSWMYGDIEEISEDLMKAFVNPFQYVVSCTWFPDSSFIGAATNVEYGWYSLSSTANKLSNTVIGRTTSIDIPKHPQSDRGVYLNGAPFSSYRLVWPCYGVFPLDANVLANYDSLVVSSRVDATSGVGILTVYPTGGDIVTPLLTTQTKIGVPVQLAQVMQSPLSLATTPIATAIGEKLGGFAGNIGDGVALASTKLQISGTNGSRASFADEPKLVCEFYNVADDDVTHRGRPLMADVVINTLSGYILCSDAELECSCTANELQTIKSYLNGGFYYE